MEGYWKRLSMVGDHARHTYQEGLRRKDQIEGRGLDYLD